MVGYILQRILAAIPVVVFVALFVFLLVRIAPGDPAAIIAGDTATAEQLAAIRESLGLNDPLLAQFWTWILNLLQGDFGTSILSGKPVIELIQQRMEPTITLALTTITLSMSIAVPLGVIAAWKHDTLIDRLVMLLSVLGFSIPVFVLGYLVISLFSMQLGWFPVQGFRPIGDGVVDFLQHIALPTLTLALLYIALIARITRASMLEVLNEDYIRTARAKGLPEIRVLMGHALRNCSVPIITIVGMGFALIVSGVVVTETVFNLPGLGRLTVDAVLARDYPVIQAVILLTSLIYVLINLIVDVSYVLLDPRIRYT